MNLSRYCVLQPRMARPTPFWCLSLFAVCAHVKPAVHALHDASSKPTIGIHTSLVSMLMGIEAIILLRHDGGSLSSITPNSHGF